MNQTISEAIEKKKILEIRYHGYSRVVEPHAYGRDKGGDEVLRCYQKSGGSESGERVGLKLLKVGEAFSIHIIDECFTPRPEYRRNDKATEHMFCQL